MAIFKNWWFRFFVTLVALFGVHMSYGGLFTQLPTSSVPSDSQRDSLAGFVSQFWEGKPVKEPDPLLRQSGLCWVTGFRGGYPATNQVSLWESRATSIPRLLSEAGLHEMEAVEVGLATDLTTYSHEPIGRQDAGVRGLLFRCTSGDLCLTPAEFPRRAELPDGQALRYTYTVGRA